MTPHPRPDLSPGSPAHPDHTLTCGTDLDEDGLDPDQRWSTYWDVERLCRGPAPIPGWLVTDDGAIDTDLGVLKTGKEANVHVVRRALRGQDGVLLAAKRYRDAEHRSFRRSAAYQDGRRMRNTRDTRALAKGTSHGRQVAAGQWAHAEWEALRRLWQLGAAVPYPVQIDGTEILMELVTDQDGEVAPRLAATRPDGPLLEAYLEQLRDFLSALGGAGLGARRPLPLQRAGRRRAPGGHRPPQVVDLVATRWGRSSCCATAPTWPPGSAGVGSTWTSTSSSARSWPRPGERATPAVTEQTPRALAARAPPEERGEGDG